MQKITPFLWFDRNAEEAMKFYVDVFNGAPNKKEESKIVSIQRYPKGSEGPMEGFDGQVLTGVFELAGETFNALDGGPLFKPNESVSFVVDCDGQEEVDYFWGKFTADGGEESACGWLKDKYGFSWQIVPKQLNELASADKSGRVIQAMLKMHKIVVKDLQDAFDGK